jgi:hypothetical protein
MLEAVFVFGAVVFGGLAFLFIKLPAKISLRLLAFPVAVDLFVTILTLVIHFGTVTGLMSAAVAGLMCSLFTTIARKTHGYIERNTYYPGYFVLDTKKLGVTKIGEPS